MRYKLVINCADDESAEAAAEAEIRRWFAVRARPEGQRMCAIGYYLGINVGEVADLSISDEDNQQVVARIRIEADTPVRTDSTAILDFAGLTGVTFIQIQPGTPQAARLPVRMGGDDLPEITTERTPLEEIFQGGQELR